MQNAWCLEYIITTIFADILLNFQLLVMFMVIPWRIIIQALFVLSSTAIGLFSIHAQTSEKLPATTVIGTETSVDYADNSPSTTVNTKFNAFDGKLTTFFASYERSGTWVGLDLGEAHVITKIAIAPRNTPEGPDRMLLGIFEGANSPDFLDAVPLWMITELPERLALTEQSVDCSKGFRYVRYIGPNSARCNIAEVAFYGYRGVGDDSYFPQLTNLPTVTIHTEEAVAITSKDYYFDGAISIIHDEGKSLFHDRLGIRGRGHSSWDFPKKPYRIKLSNKANLLGFPARSKNWTLISNYGDKTLMRNLLALELSERTGMAYTPVGIPVDVILNGEYQGTYNLCDQIEVAPGRVDVQEMTVDDVELPALSGGYLLEVDGYAHQEASWFDSAMRRTPIRIKYPDDDDIVDVQYAYIRDHYNRMESVLFSPGFRDPVNGYRKYVDIESFIRHFLVGEISGNTDTYWSTYLYKERNDDLFRFGPVWDFDIAYENDYRVYPINSQTQWLYLNAVSARGFKDVVIRLMDDNSLVERIKAVYTGYRESGILTKAALTDVVDRYAEMIDQSQQLNFMRWNVLYRLIHVNPAVFGGYAAEVEHVKRFVSERIDWMDRRLGYHPSGNFAGFPDFASVEVRVGDHAICFDQVAAPTLVSIVDITGRVVVSKSIVDHDVIPVPCGMYFVVIADAEGNKRSVKCFVN